MLHPNEIDLFLSIDSMSLKGRNKIVDPMELLRSVLQYLVLYHAITGLLGGYRYYWLLEEGLHSTLAAY